MLPEASALASGPVGRILPTNMLISVTIPNYNHAPYLPARIESVLAQTYPHFEVIGIAQDTVLKGLSFG